MKNENEELIKALDELEERIEIQIFTMSVIREHLDDLARRLEDLKKNVV